MSTHLSLADHTKTLQRSSLRQPRALIVWRGAGTASEVWAQRQIEGFRRLLCVTLTWTQWCPDDVHGLRVRHLDFPLEPQHGPRRWLLRARNIWWKNVYGTCGAEAAAIRQCLVEEAPDVILSHFGQVALRVLPVAEELRIPLVAHFHGLDVSSALRNRWYRWSLLRCLPEFAAIVVVGSHQRQWMLDHGVPPEKVHLIPCGVPTEEFSPPVERVDNPLRFIAVSRLVLWKGLDYSLRAFAELLGDHPSAQFVIIGDGPEKEPLVELTRQLGIHSAVTFLGSQSPQRVREELRKSHVFVQHSLQVNGNREGFGVSIAEASAMGLPVVATRCGGIVDQVVDGETGYLVAERDAGGMVAAMRRLAADPALRQRMGAAGRARMVERFDAIKQIAKLESVLIDAAAR